MNTNLLYALALYSISFTVVTVTACIDGDFMKDPESCDHFYKCDHGKPVKFACGPGTYFNPDINTCDWPYNVKCSVNPGGQTSGGQSTGGQSTGGRPGSGSAQNGGTSKNWDQSGSQANNQGQSNVPDQQQTQPSGSGNDGYLWPIQSPTGTASSSSPNNGGSPGQNGEERPRPTIDDLYNGNNSPYQAYLANNHFKK